MSETIPPEALEAWVRLPASLDVFLVLLAVLTVAAIVTALALARSANRSAPARIRLSMMIRLPSLLGTLAILIGAFTLAFGLDVWATGFNADYSSPRGLHEGLNHACLLFFWSTTICATGLSGTWVSGWFAKRTPAPPTGRK